MSKIEENILERSKTYRVKSGDGNKDTPEDSPDDADFLVE